MRQHAYAHSVPQTKAEHLHLASVVQQRHALHQKPDRVREQIGREIPDAQLGDGGGGGERGERGGRPRQREAAQHGEHGSRAPRGYLSEEQRREVKERCCVWLYRNLCNLYRNLCNLLLSAASNRSAFELSPYAHYFSAQATVVSVGRPPPATLERAVEEAAGQRKLRR